ncbi:ester cyclase [Halogeometricum borinquense]|uniref:Ester cyclase n=1 Tax=Halogeometricum borinquense TaxID=60847 RepID=A0A6C0UD78_9EURY|nr:ester cyclase [Halogeometricum borinquense]QIB73265.1 ester cyclase [Halogeometricum borinquense]QIQ77340.1 ester cyclase [Halogeometricum borinquense]
MQTDTQYDPEQSRRNAETIRRYHEITEGDLAAADEVLAEEVVVHGAFDGEETHGIEAFRERLAGIHDSFSGFSVEIHDIVAQADGGASRWTVSGTFEEPYDGIEPDGERKTNPGISMFRFEDGKIVEIWDREDTHSALQQMGAVPDDA